MTAGEAQAAVADLSAAVDALLSVSFEGLPTPALTRLVGDLEVQRRRLAGVDQRLIAVLATSGAVLGTGATSLADLLAGLTRCGRGEARARVGRSVDLGPRRAVSGEVLEPIHPLTAAAVAVGEVSEAQCQVIVSALAKIGPDAEVGAFEVAERFLVEAARREPPAALARSARWVLARLDPSGLEPSERTAERTRNFSLGDAPDADGVVAAKGRLTPETAAALRVVLGALSTPRPGEGSGERDKRSLGQRQHDALLEIALRILRTGELPDSGGVPASVIIQLRALNVTPPPNPHAPAATATNAHYSADDPCADDPCADDPSADDPSADETFAGEAPCDEASDPDPDPDPDIDPDIDIDPDPDPDIDIDFDAAELAAAGVGTPRPGQVRARLARLAQLGTEGPVNLDRLRPLLDSCDITTVVLNAEGGILDYGRERRTPPPAMRRALTGRDGGCCFPGCDRPPAWTQAHHIRAWIDDDGPTSTDNLCLLCAYHHRMFQPAGWQVHMRDGLPWWTPPAWLDPHRTPIRNTTRHLPAIDFGQADAVMRT